MIKKICIHIHIIHFYNWIHKQQGKYIHYVISSLIIALNAEIFKSIHILLFFE